MRTNHLGVAAAISRLSRNGTRITLNILRNSQEGRPLK
jgi:hypothetical protein